MHFRVETTIDKIRPPIAVSAKRHENELYLFAVPMRLGPTRGQFVITDIHANYPIEVIDEDRQIQSADSSFSDDFATYQVHRYRLADYFAR